jgi:hypothetical protein
MTIAAGLLCNEGVLICADTEETSWIMKSHASKIRHFEFPGGAAAFAYAGNTRFASSAIRKCQTRLIGLSKRSSGKPVDPISEIEGILDREYRRNVLSHPGYATDSSLYYQLLIALWVEGCETKLYVADQTALDEIPTFECIGIGESLARHLIASGHSGGMEYNRALPLAAYTLALVKDQVKDCDGMSIFVFVGNDGKIGTVTSLHDGPCVQLERYARSYDSLCRRLLTVIADPALDPKYFEPNLDSLFIQEIRRMFSEIVADRNRREQQIAVLNPHFTPDRVRQLVVQLSTGLPIGPQPSPESRGGTGEF